MKSSGPVFTRQNPFPPASTVRAHYHPSRKQSLSSREKATRLSPSHLTLSPTDPPQSLNRESQQSNENHDHNISVADKQQRYTEIWPSIDCELAPDSAPPSPELVQHKRSESFSVFKATTEESQLAKYIERFRHGRPQSREERHQTAAEEEERPFWWKLQSAIPTSTPTRTTEKVQDGQEAEDLSPFGENRYNTSIYVSSDCSQGEFEEKEIFHLQERASRLLLRGEGSRSDRSVSVSSDGLGGSDSLLSEDELVRQPQFSSSSKSPFAKFCSESVPAATLQRSGLPSPLPSDRPEEDILFQWRLRRKMEQARGWPPSVQQSGLRDPAFGLRPVSGQPNEDERGSLPPRFLQSDAPLRMSSQPEITKSPSLPSVPQPRALPHVPAHMHLICDVLPCAVQSLHSEHTHHAPQSSHEPQSKSVHKTTQVPENSLNTFSEVQIQEPVTSPRISQVSKEESGYVQPKASKRTKKQKAENKNSEENKKLPSSIKVSSRQGVTQKVKPVKEQHQCERSLKVQNDQEPPASPIHTTSGQVAAEVLFPTAISSPAQPPQVPSEFPPHTVSSRSQPSVSPTTTQTSLEVISQLLQEAEDSDEKEFEDDPLLQVLRQNRKWVKGQIREVDVLLSMEEEKQVS